MLFSKIKCVNNMLGWSFMFNIHFLIRTNVALMSQDLVLMTRSGHYFCIALNSHTHIDYFNKKSKNILKVTKTFHVVVFRAYFIISTTFLHCSNWGYWLILGQIFIWHHFEWWYLHFHKVFIKKWWLTLICLFFCLLLSFYC